MKKYTIALCLFSSALFAQNAKQPGSAVKTSLNAYSFNKNMTVSKSMTLFQLLDYAAEQNFDAIDITAYFFPGYPNVPSDEVINNVKRKAFQLGLDISGTGVKNDFANPDPAKRAADVKHVKEWIDVAVKLGAPVIRVFAGPVPSGYEGKWDEVAKYMAQSLKECADYGRQKGVLVGVQNHGDFLKTADEAIKIVKMVNSEWFGVIVDTGYFITKDPYADIEKIMPYAVNFQIKESPFGPRSTIKTDLPRLMKIINKSGYRGYLPIETLEIKGEPRPVPDIPYNPFVLVPAFLKDLKAAIHSEYKREH
ncbi:sugar phosphate isomerase/epimerase family protein [Pedobacter heparinus]|uniref:Xylose isomerase domain protein TIM barrel n=1 Tax=Pedobacter heparinus (strain ATCC 13125 / DSM 2366 / CIP 104194 / JCM 7457 / NBRC 12017 / NCIMB 9290 / NRRL B-14731 / HIM 762-3) TaxID=485917 RepID=C6Y327_PEDHD|nr:sugar phosphate isomerase/epimerase family protein [Pedobacter heparinus]ACU03240.1 Xylose isomerase domain protein TIM barrel [Pedobacter heparinus DSM 2366]